LEGADGSRALESVVVTRYHPARPHARAVRGGQVGEVPRLLAIGSGRPEFPPEKDLILERVPSRWRRRAEFPQTGHEAPLVVRGQTVFVDAGDALLLPLDFGEPNAETFGFIPGD